MNNPTELRQQIKQLIVANLMLQITSDEIGDEQPLFGPGGLGLDSVDALQLVVALDKDYGLKISDPETARHVLMSVDAIATALQQHLSANPVGLRAKTECTLQNGIDSACAGRHQGLHRQTEGTI